MSESVLWAVPIEKTPGVLRPRGSSSTTLRQVRGVEGSALRSRARAAGSIALGQEEEIVEGVTTRDIEYVDEERGVAVRGNIVYFDTQTFKGALKASYVPTALYYDFSKYVVTPDLARKDWAIAAGKTHIPFNGITVEKFVEEYEDLNPGAKQEDLLAVFNGHWGNFYDPISIMMVDGELILRKANVPGLFQDDGYEPLNGKFEVFCLDKGREGVVEIEIKDGKLIDSKGIKNAIGGVLLVSGGVSNLKNLKYRKPAMNTDEVNWPIVWTVNSKGVVERQTRSAFSAIAKTRKGRVFRLFLTTKDGGQETNIEEFINALLEAAGEGDEVVEALMLGGSADMQSYRKGYGYDAAVAREASDTVGFERFLASLLIATREGAQEAPNEINIPDLYSKMAASAHAAGSKERQVREVEGEDFEYVATPEELLEVLADIPGCRGRIREIDALTRELWEPRPVQLIIVGAGKGTRFEESVRKHNEATGDDVPVVNKSVALVGDKPDDNATDDELVIKEPAIKVVLDNVLELREAGIEVETPIVVCGVDNEVEIKEALDGYDVIYVLQDPVCGTGDAVRCAQDEMQGFEGDAVVIWSTMTLVRPDTAERAIKIHQSIPDCAMTYPAVWTRKPYAPLTIAEGTAYTSGTRETHLEGAPLIDEGANNIGAFIVRAQELFWPLQAYWWEAFDPETGKYKGLPNEELGFPNTIGRDLSESGRTVIAAVVAGEHEDHPIKVYEDVELAAGYRATQLRQRMLEREGDEVEFEYAEAEESGDELKGPRSLYEQVIAPDNKILGYPDMRAYEQDFEDFYRQLTAAGDAILGIEGMEAYEETFEEIDRIAYLAETARAETPQEAERESAERYQDAQERLDNLEATINFVGLRPSSDFIINGYRAEAEEYIRGMRPNFTSEERKWLLTQTSELFDAMYDLEGKPAANNLGEEPDTADSEKKSPVDILKERQGKSWRRTFTALDTILRISKGIQQDMPFEYVSVAIDACIRFARGWVRPTDFYMYGLPAAYEASYSFGSFEENVNALSENFFVLGMVENETNRAKLLSRFRAEVLADAFLFSAPFLYFSAPFLHEGPEKFRTRATEWIAKQKGLQSRAAAPAKARAAGLGRRIWWLIEPWVGIKFTGLVVGAGALITLVTIQAAKIGGIAQALPIALVGVTLMIIAISKTGKQFLKNGKALTDNPINITDGASYMDVEYYNQATGVVAEGRAIYLDPEKIEITPHHVKGATNYDFDRFAVDPELAERLRKPYMEYPGMTTDEFFEMAAEHDACVGITDATERNFWEQDFVIADGRLIVRGDAPGLFQKEHAPLKGVFQAFVLDKGREGIERSLYLDEERPYNGSITNAIQVVPIIERVEGADGVARARVCVGDLEVKRPVENSQQVNWPIEDTRCAFSAIGKTKNGRIVLYSLRGMQKGNGRKKEPTLSEFTSSLLQIKLPEGDRIIEAGLRAGGPGAFQGIKGHAFGEGEDVFAGSASQASDTKAVERMHAVGLGLWRRGAIERGASRLPAEITTVFERREARKHDPQRQELYAQFANLHSAVSAQSPYSYDIANIEALLHNAEVARVDSESQRYYEQADGAIAALLLTIEHAPELPADEPAQGAQAKAAGAVETPQAMIDEFMQVLSRLSDPALALTAVVIATASIVGGAAIYFAIRGKAFKPPEWRGLSKKDDDEGDDSPSSARGVGEGLTLPASDAEYDAIVAKIGRAVELIEGKWPELDKFRMDAKVVFVYEEMRERNYVLRLLDMPINFDFKNKLTIDRNFIRYDRRIMDLSDEMLACVIAHELKHVEQYSTLEFKSDFDIFLWLYKNIFRTIPIEREAFCQEIDMARRLGFQIDEKERWRYLYVRFRKQQCIALITLPIGFIWALLSGIFYLRNEGAIEQTEQGRLGYNAAEGKKARAKGMIAGAAGRIDEPVPAPKITSNL